nr:PREDICTED: zeta-sarcoglycan [Latimeria chalumnae]|eukprot:XP_014352478.1 PREDICTED: zeta-sarcoglycan [Latimeria chalumnae]
MVRGARAINEKDGKMDYEALKDKCAHSWSSGTLTYNASEKLAELLRSYTLGSQSMVIDSIGLADYIQRIQTEEDEIMVSFYMVSLYTNTPIKESLQIIQTFLEGNQLQPSGKPVPAYPILQLAKFCLAITCFTYNNIYYEQMDRVATGFPASLDGMGNLRVNKKGIRLEGISEFLLPLYVKEIHSRKDSPLILQSDRNVTVNARNHLGQLTGQLTVGAEAVEAQCKKFEVRASEGGRVLFSADEDEITIGADRLKVTGTEGVVFEHSVETPHVRAEPSQDLKLESPTRTLTMEAPKGVQISADAGDFKATCRKELQLQSTEGEIFLNANIIRLGNLPQGSFSASSPSSMSPQQTVYELCVCSNGKLYLSPAGAGSTCQSSSNVCLWS